MNIIRAFGQQPILWLLLILTISQLALGVFNSVTMARLDASYSSLISNDFALVGDMRNVSRQSAEVQRSVLNLVIAHSSEETVLQKQKLQNARTTNELYVNKLTARFKDHTENPKLQALMHAREKYMETVDTLTGLLEGGQSDAAAPYRIKTMRPAYDAYLQTQDDLADAIYHQADAHSRELSNQSSRLRVVSVFLAALPVMLGMIVSIIIVALIMWVKPSIDD